MNKRRDADASQASAIAVELRVLIGGLMRRLREQADTEDFSWSQKSVFVRLERDGPATVTTLARAERVRPQSMGATIAKMEEAGLVSGAPDPGDGRQTIYSLTAKCHALVKAKRRAREDWLSQALESKLTSGERKQLAAAVELLKRLAD